MSENNEFKEIDLNQLQKVEVRDNIDGEGYKAKLISIDKESSFPYYVILDSDGSINKFAYCRPYKEPTKRPMTDREIFNALKKEDCWLRLPENTINQFFTWNAQWIAEEYEITYDGGETWHKLEVEE